MKVYSREEVETATLSYFKGDHLATQVWIDKYCLKDNHKNLFELTPDDMHHRLAKEFARIEQEYKNPMDEQEIYELLKDFKYIVPQGSPMFGIGNDSSITSLSNCFVVGSNDDSDSYGSIFRTDEEGVQLMKRRGGVGNDLSHLRPSGAIANNAILAGISGATIYMDRYSESTREVSQGNRRGARMLSMSIKHPDAGLFIDKKMVEGKVTGANISVKLTDEFMEAVKGDLDFYQTFPVGLKTDIKTSDTSLEYNRLYQLDDEVYIKRIRARELWDKIIHNAWSKAEPGVLFWDTIIKESPSDCYEGFKTVSVNPCGEVPLCEYDSCRLLVLNLYSYVDNPFSSSSNFELDLFINHVFKAQRLMDDLVDLEIEKIDKIISKIKSDTEPDDLKKVELNLWEKIREKSIKGRRTGLGITGEGDMLAALGYKYASSEGNSFCEQLHMILAVTSYESSLYMAEERGCFPIWSLEDEKDNPFIHRILEASIPYLDIEYEEYGRRNISNLTISPTGTTSLMTQTSSGIEPCFQPYYFRRKKTNDKNRVTFIDNLGDTWEEYPVFHHKFKVWYDLNWFKLDSDLFNLDFHKQLEDFSKEELEELVKKSPYHLSCANDIDWESKVELQGRVQRWIDHSISVTTNLPKGTPKEVVERVYMKAWEVGCKGHTVYVDGCRDGVLLTGKEEKGFSYNDAIKRPKELEVDIYRKTALKRDWIILVGLMNEKPYEIFAFPSIDNTQFPHSITNGKLAKSKSRHYKLVGVKDSKEYTVPNIIDLMSDVDQVDTRKYSIMLRHGIHPKFICSNIEEYAIINSFDKVIQRVLKNYLTDEEIGLNLCPECSGLLRNDSGCVVCLDCGWSKCS